MKLSKAWIPVLTVLITSFFGFLTTVTVAWINTGKKADRMNRTYQMQQRETSPRMLETMTPNEPFAKAKFTLKKGFYVETNK